MNLSLAKAVDRVAGNVVASGYGAADGIASLFAPPAPPIEDVRAIAVFKFWGIGNWALLRPVVRDLRDRWPGARLLVVTLESNRPLVEDLADDVALLRPRGFTRLAIDMVHALRRLRRHAPTMSLDFEQFSRAGALLARAAGVPQRIGFVSGSRARDGLYTVRVPFRRDAHASRSFRDLAEAAGVPHAAYVPGALEPTAEGRGEAAALLGDAPPGRPLVVLHPGSGDNFPGRRWSEAGFAALARHAVERHGARVVVTGSASEADLCARVARTAGRGVETAAGLLSLPGLVALLARSAVLVSNDTGPVHVASALSRPVLALFGPNTPVLYGPLSSTNGAGNGAGSIALWKALPCSPCLTEANYRSSRCRIHSCMAAIATGEATAALDRILRESLRAEEAAPCPDAATR